MARLGRLSCEVRSELRRKLLVVVFLGAESRAQRFSVGSVQRDAEAAAPSQRQAARGLVGALLQPLRLRPHKLPQVLELWARACRRSQARRAPPATVPGASPGTPCRTATSRRKRGASGLRASRSKKASSRSEVRAPPQAGQALGGAKAVPRRKQGSLRRRTASESGSKPARAPPSQCGSRSLGGCVPRNAPLPRSASWARRQERSGKRGVPCCKAGRRTGALAGRALVAASRLVGSSEILPRRARAVALKSASSRRSAGRAGEASCQPAASGPPQERRRARSSASRLFSKSA